MERVRNKPGIEDVWWRSDGHTLSERKSRWTGSTVFSTRRDSQCEYILEGGAKVKRLISKDLRFGKSRKS